MCYSCITSYPKLVHLLVSHKQAHSLSFVFIIEKVTSKHDNVAETKETDLLSHHLGPMTSYVSHFTLVLEGKVHKERDFCLF